MEFAQLIDTVHLVYFQYLKITVYSVAYDFDDNIWFNAIGIGLGKLDLKTLSVEQLPSSLYSLYPNPTKNSITISLERSGTITKYQIYDMEGNSKLVGNGSKTRKQTINIESLPAGVYMIELITEDNKYVRDKFIKE